MGGGGYHRLSSAFGLSRHALQDFVDRAVGEVLQLGVGAILDRMGHPHDVGVIAKCLRLNVGGLDEGGRGHDESRNAGVIEI